MKRGEVWRANLPLPAGRRPVILLSRDEAYAVRSAVSVAPVTTTNRAIPVEVQLGTEDGLSKPCVVNLDSILTIPKARLLSKIALLSETKIVEIDQAIRFALGLD
jgi:mRNA interferase MazF